MICALAGVALLSSFLIKGLELDRALETEQGFKVEETIRRGEVKENDEMGLLKIGIIVQSVYIK